MRLLVIGYGSIGARHARLLKEQGHDVHCVTRNPECPFPASASLNEALATFSPENVIISNATNAHYTTLSELLHAGFTGPILVEKPLFDTLPTDLPPVPNAIHTAYNLRFHPLVQQIREALNGKQIFSARLHVGQFLPDWRPGTDYTESYSAKRSQGGGVLRDLSHELDLALWLLGPWRRVTAMGGHFSDLDIDSDDVFSILMETDRCPAVSIHMDYLSTPPRRGIEINGQGISLYADFISGTLDINGEVAHILVERDATYEAQLTTFCSGNTDILCTLDEGMDVLRLIEAVEKSATERIWVETT